METECDYLFILPDAERRKVLVVQDGAALRLPRVRGPQGWVAELVGQLGRELAEQLGIYARVIRHVAGEPVEVCEAELTQPVDESGAFRWIEAGFETQRHRIDDGDAAIISTWFEHSEVPDSRAPWERPGWFEPAASWLESTLRDRGFQPGERTVVKGAWPASCVIRQTTDAGDFYLKAVFAKPPTESALLPLLRERFGALVPEVVAVDPERRWVITRGFGAEADHAAAEQAVLAYARMQLAIHDELSMLEPAGCPDMTPDALMAELQRVRADVEALRERRAVVPPSTVVSPDTALAMLQPLVDQLAASPIGASLVHQDFRLGNIASGPHGPLIYDWSDSVIAHPFFGGVRVFDFLPMVNGGSELDLEAPGDGKAGAIRDAYLAPFIERFGFVHVQRDFALVWKLRAAVQACRWHLELRYLEPGAPWALWLEELVVKEWDRVTVRCDDAAPSNAFARFGPGD